MLGEKAGWELQKDSVCSSKQILEATPHKTAAVWPLSISETIRDEQEMLDICGDLGINSKNSQPDIDSSAARYKMYKRVATHKAPRIHPVKIRKKKNNKM